MAFYLFTSSVIPGLSVNTFFPYAYTGFIFYYPLPGSISPTLRFFNTHKKKGVFSS